MAKEKKKLGLRDYAVKKARYDEEADKLKKEIALLKEKMDKYKERSGLCSERIIKLLQKQDKTRVISGVHQYDMAKTPGKLVIPDEKLVPKAYMKSITTTSVDKAKLKERISEGKITVTGDDAPAWFNWEVGYTLKHKVLKEPES